MNRNVPADFTEKRPIHLAYVALAEATLSVALNLMGSLFATAARATVDVPVTLQVRNITNQIQLNFWISRSSNYLNISSLVMDMVFVY